jgi:hypothetical protein
MAIISFETARDITTESQKWMKKVSNFIKKPAENPVPTDIYDTQKLAFEINKDELQSIITQSSKIVGILGYDDAGSLTVIFVGTDDEYAAKADVLPAQTWPKMDGLDDLDAVLNKYLTP